MKLKELSKNKYGKLTVIHEYKYRYSNGRSCRKLKCLCDCGKITNPVKEKVVCGKTQSCGCGQEEMRKSLGKKMMLPLFQASINEVFNVYKNSAIKRGFAFELNMEEFIDIVTRECIYCGDSLTNEHNKPFNNGNFLYTGIDRYDNEKGYIKSNCVSCCSVCNRMKTNMSVDDFKNKIIKIINNSNVWERTA